MDASKHQGDVVVSVLNPGFVATSIMRNQGGWLQGKFLSFFKKTTARTAEEGGRTLVWAAYGGRETHGKFLDDCKVGKVATYVVTEKGHLVQKKLWAELAEKLEAIQPGIMASV
jgi:retinol dehydrogenase-12